MFDNLSDTQRIVITFCAVAFVFMLIGAVLFSMFIRSFRHFWIVGVVNKLIGTTKDIADDTDSLNVPQRTPVDLHAKVEALDFEASVAKYAMNEPVPPQFADEAAKSGSTPENTESTDDESGGITGIS